MNKFLKLTILIVVAAGIIFLLDWLSGPGDDRTVIELGANLTEKEFEAKCKQLASKPWDKNSFEAIKVDLRNYGQQGVITNEEANRFEGYLYTNYSNSLNNSFTQWLNNNCDSDIDDLYKEMQAVASAGEYKLILNNSLEILEKYYAATSLPERVKEHIASEYIESIHQSIVLDINNLCQNENLKKCSRIQSIKDEQIAIMAEFKSFFKNYIDAYKSAIIDPANSLYNSELESFCPENDSTINKYKFYQNQIKIFNLCYP